MGCIQSVSGTQMIMLVKMQVTITEMKSIVKTFLTEADCGMHSECEWHADDNACEDAGHDHDHEHCEDLVTQEDCEASEHCEWHEHDGEFECEDSHGDVDCDETDHANVDGLAIEYEGLEIYRQFQGFVEGSLELPVNYTKDYTIHFIDNNGDEIELENPECYPLSFEIDNSGIVMIEMEGDHDHEGGHDHEEAHITFEMTGLAMGFTTFSVSIMHQGHADYTSMPIPVTVTEEISETVSGDVNLDGDINVLDVVYTVGYILGNVDNLNTESFQNADLNDDNFIDVLDIILLVEMALNDRSESNATFSVINIDNNSVLMEANGYVGAIQMTLEHNDNFSIKLNNNALVSDYKTVGNQTMIIIVCPKNELFVASGDYEITEVLAATSDGYINVSINNPNSFNLGAAYPNPFNPSTSFDLRLDNSSFISVVVYDIMGQVVSEIYEGNMEPGLHTMLWNANGVSTGTYILRVVNGNKVATQKLMYIKYLFF